MDSASVRRSGAEQVHNERPGSVLALGVDSGAVYVCLLESVFGRFRLLQWERRARAAQLTAAAQVAQVCQQMGTQLGRPLWNNIASVPFLESNDPVRQPPLHQVVATVSPLPRLRVWLAGLSRAGSLAAAQDALQRCPVQVVGYTSLPVPVAGGALAEAFATAQPQALVICGGYDTDTPTMQAALRRVCGALGNALKRISPAHYPTVIYAGNRWAANAAVETLRADVNTLRWKVVANVQPAPHVTDPAPLAQALHDLYGQLSRQTSTYAEIARWVTHPAQVASMEANFARLVQVWMHHCNLAALHGLYGAPGWRLHVRAELGVEGVHFHFSPPRATPIELDQWPAVRLISGADAAIANTSATWCDPLGLAPVLAAVGQIAPQAMLQVVKADLFQIGIQK